MSDPGEALRRLAPGRVIVYGDLMLDEYLFGRADRLSPEKPVPVVAFERRDLYLGGAGNVVRNLAALGCEPVLVSLVGDDPTGSECRAMLEAEGLDTAGLVESAGRTTPRKLRVHAGQHALVRIDYEDGEPAPGPDDPETGRVLERLAALGAGCSAAIVSDYRKGTVTAAGVAELARAAGGAPVVADPKGTDPERYRGATHLLPNEPEMADLLGAGWGEADARSLREGLGLEAIVLTRSERGVRVYGAGGTTEVPARARQVFDVTGAGDTFAAAFAAFLASGEDAVDAARLANVAAGVKVRKVGTAVVTPAEIEAELERDRAPRDKRVSREVAAALAAERRARGETVVFTNGCFDLLHAGHIRFLEAARRLGDCLIVGLNTDASVRRLKGPDRPILDAEERGQILSALTCVDHVVLFGEDTPIGLIEAIGPDVLAKGADYAPDEIVGAEEVRSRGGRVERIELVAGKSTSRIVEKILQRKRE